MSFASIVPAPRRNTLKVLAEHLGLSTASVSLVINGSPGAKSIPQHTQDRIHAAARELNYRPNFMASSLRRQRSLTIGVLVPELSEGYAPQVISGIEDYLLETGYFYFVVSHRHREDLLSRYPRLLQQRAVEGLIAVDTVCEEAMLVPMVSVSGHRDVEGVTNIALNHRQAARMALEHLYALGHRSIAFIKGQDFSSDTEVRWQAIGAAAKELGLQVDTRLVVQLEGDCPTSDLGFKVTRNLLAAKRNFTALFAFNDISAIGAIHALRAAGCRVPEDVSVVGFDDIPSAAFQNPGLTTVRQPLREMGVLAAETLLRRISAAPGTPYAKLITVEPELIIRASTAAVSHHTAKRADYTVDLRGAEHEAKK
jgi:DNA-binding LacI/PurR family transcriptional regulator